MNKLLVAAVKLYHKKEQEAFDDLHTLLCLQTKPAKRKGRDLFLLWHWGLHRWKKDWVDMDYRLGLGANDKAKSS